MENTMNTSDDPMKLIADKAAILSSSLPYLRDFNQKIVVIAYLCSDLLSSAQEQEIMRDITLLKSVGMKPVIIHDVRLGADKFRENKRLAKLVEFCGTKAIGICGIDEQTLHMTLDNGYIPVITPNDIDTEYMPLDPADTALKIAALLQAEKMIYLGRYTGLYDDEGTRMLSITCSELKTYMDTHELDVDLLKKLNNMLSALEQGVTRSHLISAEMAHSLLLELFSIKGVGTVVMSDERKMYAHEILAQDK